MKSISMNAIQERKIFHILYNFLSSYDVYLEDKDVVFYYSEEKSKENDIYLDVYIDKDLEELPVKVHINFIRRK